MEVYALCLQVFSYGMYLFYDTWHHTFTLQRYIMVHVIEVCTVNVGYELLTARVFHIMVVGTP